MMRGYNCLQKQILKRLAQLASKLKFASTQVDVCGCVGEGEGVRDGLREYT